MARMARVRLDVPAGLAKSIGRVISAYTVMDWWLRRLCYEALGVTDKAGRIAVREGSAEKQWQIFLSLCRLQKIKIDIGAKLVAKNLHECSRRRNEYAHGLWLEDNGTLYLRLTRGEWQAHDPKAEKVKRIVMPEGEPRTSADVDVTYLLIVDIVKQLESLHQQVLNQSRTRSCSGA